LQHHSSPTLDNSQASVGIFFDILQSWALNFVQYTFEPIMIELKRSDSSNLSDVAMVQPSIADPMKREVLAQTTFKDQRADLSKARNVALQSKQALKKSSEMKTLADVALILANVSSFFHIFALH
jgi:hypothetical protein